MAASALLRNSLCGSHVELSKIVTGRLPAAVRTRPVTDRGAVEYESTISHHSGRLLRRQFIEPIAVLTVSEPATIATALGGLLRIIYATPAYRSAVLNRGWPMSSASFPGLQPILGAHIPSHL